MSAPGSAGRPVVVVAVVAAAVAAIGALAVAGAGCTVQDTVASRPCPLGQACPAQDRAGFCDGSTPPMLVGTGSDAPYVCAGALAGLSFGRALCTCGELSLNFALTTDSFDSARGPYAPGGVEGSVGINGKLETTAALDVGGSLAVAGAEGINANTELTVAGDLASAGQLGSTTASVTVDGDAYVAGSIEVAEASVAGALTIPADQTVSVSGALMLGETRRVPVSVAPPCPCGEADEIDVSGFIGAQRLSNHNADIGLDAAVLRDLQQDATLELPCGRFYLDSIQAPRDDVYIRIVDRVALFVDRGITVGGNLQIEVLPDAELDLFIAGNINVGGTIRVGDPERPRQIRIYVAAAGAINLSADSFLNANLYAPGVSLFLSAGAEVFGAMFVTHLLTSAPVSVHRDTAIRTVADQCPESSPGSS